MVGAPRTGTSILHELLACDPETRAPAMWEMLHPVESLAGADALPVADATVQLWHDLQPEYETMHANSGALPNECIFITMNEFLSDQWSGCHVVPTYDAHLRRADHRDAYRFHRKVLQTLQQRARGRRWVLKAPSHLGQLRALFAVYPEARIVHIHRDPLEVPALGAEPDGHAQVDALRGGRPRPGDRRPPARLRGDVPPRDRAARGGRAAGRAVLSTSATPT